MNKSITQNNQNDNQISKTIRKFFTRFHLSSALKAANAYKKKRHSCISDFPVPVSFDFFQQKHVHESPYRQKYTGFFQRHSLPFYENAPDSCESIWLM